MNGEIIAKVSREFAAKRQAALLDATRRRERLYETAPGLTEIDARIAAAARENFMGQSSAAEFETRLAALEQDRNALIKMAGIDIAPRFACSVCEDTGRVEGGYCNCFKNRVIEENLAGANLAVSSGHERFERFDLALYSDVENAKLGISPRAHMARVLARCKRFVSEFDEGTKNLLLVGRPGLGKTFLSSAIAHALLEQGKTVIYMSVAEFAARAQAHKFGDSESEMEQYYETDLLILDDLGTEFKTQFTGAVLGELIDRRLRQGKKMVFSTNLNLKQLEEFYSARIISRFMGGFDYLQFIGDDIRLKQK